MATHSSTLAWKVPWTEEPGRLQSKGLTRLRDFTLNSQEGTQLHPSTENWIKALLRPSFPPSQFTPSGSFHKPLILLHQGADTENHNHRKLTSLITWTTALSDSVKLWVMSCRANQDGHGGEV